MFAKLFASAAAILLCVHAVSAQNRPPSRRTLPDDESGAVKTTSVAPSLAGTWKARTERLPLTGDFNEKVWGKGAASIRDVTLSVRPSGEATLTISRKVVDARGRIVPGSSSLEEATITIGAATPGFASRVDHDVKVVKAERRYPDSHDDRWPIDNLRVSVVTFSDGRNTLEVRFDPPDGQGSFAELLTRGVSASGKTPHP